MATITEIHFDKEYIETYSQKKNEPEWMRNNRLEAFDLAHSLPLPKPDKTNINRWNFTNFKHDAEGEKITDLTNVPESLKSFIDPDALPENIVILRNQTEIGRAHV